MEGPRRHRPPRILWPVKLPPDPRGGRDLLRHTKLWDFTDRPSAHGMVVKIILHGKKMTQAESGLQAETGFFSRNKQKQNASPFLFSTDVRDDCVNWMLNLFFFFLLSIFILFYFIYFLFFYFLKLSLSGYHWLIKSILGTKILDDHSKRKNETWRRFPDPRRTALLEGGVQIKYAYCKPFKYL